jgi:hypothetical protein
LSIWEFVFIGSESVIEAMALSWHSHGMGMFGGPDEDTSSQEVPPRRDEKPHELLGVWNTRRAYPDLGGFRAGFSVGGGTS